VEAFLSFLEQNTRYSLLQIYKAMLGSTCQLLSLMIYDQEYYIPIIMEQKLSLGNFDKSSFLEKLKENLLKIPNLPLHKETYMREGKGIEISSHLKKRGKALE
jgi:hypothetical protein